MKKSLIWLIIGLACALYFFYERTWLGSTATIALTDVQSDAAIDTSQLVSVGAEIPLSLRAENQESAICQVTGELSLPNNYRSVVFDYQANQDTTIYNPVRNFGKIDKFKKVLSLRAKTSHGLSDLDGQTGQLTVTVDDCSIFGKKTVLNINVKIDNQPPIVAVTSTQHYINQGGAGVVTYQVSADTTWSGVKIGDYTFKGYPKPGTTTNEHFAFFVYSYELPIDTTIEVMARDSAGNLGKSKLTPAKFFAKEFRHRDLQIDDKFIETKIADIIANTPELTDQGNNLKNYLLVNRELRKADNDFLKNLAQKSAPHFYWRDSFMPLGNAAIEASFADYRNYIYNGQKIDEQVHLGFDMAALEHYPISSSAAGKVVFSDYLGIYGNAIVIDHGYGLMSLYGHLSGMDVKVGDMVTRGQKIANSGATGLAGGDHLHYSMLIDGVQTNPIEFWDQHWIADNVYLRLGEGAFEDGTLQ